MHIKRYFIANLPSEIIHERGAPRGLLTDDLRGGEFDHCITPCVLQTTGSRAPFPHRIAHSVGLVMSQCAPPLWMAFHARVDLPLRRRVHSHRGGRTCSSRSDEIGRGAIRCSRRWRSRRMLGSRRWRQELSRLDTTPWSSADIPGSSRLPRSPLSLHS